MRKFIEDIAIALHNHYLGFASKGDASVAFDELQEDYKRSLLDQAEYWFTQIEDAGYQLIRGESKEGVVIPEGIVEFWAEREHDRFVRERLTQGWRLGYPKQGPPKRISPYLVPFDELSMRIADYDRHFARVIPEILRSVGLIITGRPKKDVFKVPERIFKIGIIGHRHINNPDVLRKKLHDAIAEMVESVIEDDIVIVTSLAEGTDQLGAQVGIEDFSFKLKVVLPLEKGRYFSTFETSEGVKKAEDFMSKANRIITLPPVIMPDDRVGEVSEEQLAFQQAGRYVVDDSNALIVVWNGSNGGVGGTGDTMEYLRSLKGTWDVKYRIIEP